MLKKVNLYYQKKFSLKNRSLLKSNITKIFKAEKIPFSHVSIIFCSDKYLLGLNRDFLRHDFYTDIITFPLNELGTPVQAEIYISVDRVQDNAAQNGVSFSHEIKRVVYHGILHLCGFDDHSNAEKALMRQKEEYYLQLL